MINGPNPDSDVHVYDIQVSEQNQQFFSKIVETHKDLFDEPPDGEEWLHSPPPHTLTNLGAPPESVKAILKVIADVWMEEVLDVEDNRFQRLLKDMEIDAWDDDRVPDALKD